MLEAIDRGVLEPGAVDEDDLDIVFRGLFPPAYDEGTPSPKKDSRNDEGTI